MHLAAYAMSDELSHDTETTGLTVILDSIAYVTETLADNCLLNPEIKGLLGDIQQLLHFGSYFADSKSISGITAKAVKLDTAINRNYVTILENLVRRDAVHHDIIDRGTD